MKRDHLSGFSSDPRIIENYNLLEKLGIWQKIDRMNQKISSLEELIKEVANLFTKTDIREIINFIVSKILDKFIPHYLAFVLKENVHTDNTDIICFDNMKPTKDLFSITSLEPFDKFFHSRPGVTAFADFKAEIGNTGITDPLLVLQPALVVPISGIDEIYGFIIIGRKVVQQEYASEEINYIDQLIRFASLSFQNNIHYTSAITDNKTGAYNHAYFKNRLEEEIGRIKRYHHQSVLIMLDIDHFKKFNDNYGHLAGDLVLKKITQALHYTLRHADIVARFGGEEFIVLLVETNYDDGWIVAERLRKQIAALKIEYEKKLLQVNISLGLRHFDHTVTETGEVLTQQADAALYQSKTNGRNQTTYFKKE